MSMSTLDETSLVHTLTEAIGTEFPGFQTEIYRQAGALSTYTLVFARDVRVPRMEIIGKTQEEIITDICGKFREAVFEPFYAPGTYWAGKLAEKDAVIAERDREIAELRAAVERLKPYQAFAMVAQEIIHGGPK